MTWPGAVAGGNGNSADGRELFGDQRSNNKKSGVLEELFCGIIQFLKAGVTLILRIGKRY